jgi:16S rRNA U516 pseudouridylate synthase RsuA-like enzyme
VKRLPVLDCSFKRIIRKRIGTLELGDLPKGRWRHLSQKEINALKKELV